MTIEFRASATRDLKRSAAFFDEQEAGLGDEFLSEMQQALAELSFCGGIHRKRHGFHCMLVSRFHHLVYYFVEGSTVIMCAILDGRRNPETLVRTLKTRRS